MIRTTIFDEKQKQQQKKKHLTRSNRYTEFGNTQKSKCKLIVAFLMLNSPY